MLVLSHSFELLHVSTTSLALSLCHENVMSKLGAVPSSLDPRIKYMEKSQPSPTIAHM